MQALYHQLSPTIPWLAVVSLSMAAPPLAATEISVGRTTYSTDYATTTAEIVSGGYTTSDQAKAFPSWTSADWTVGRTLGTYFRVPSFQPGYDISRPSRAGH